MTEPRPDAEAPSEEALRTAELRRHRYGSQSIANIMQAVLTRHNSRKQRRAARLDLMMDTLKHIDVNVRTRPGY